MPRIYGTVTDTETHECPERVWIDAYQIKEDYERYDPDYTGIPGLGVDSLPIINVVADTAPDESGFYELELDEGDYIFHVYTDEEDSGYEITSTWYDNKLGASEANILHLTEDTEINFELVTPNATITGTAVNLPENTIIAAVVCLGINNDILFWDGEKIRQQGEFFFYADPSYAYPISLDDGTFEITGLYDDVDYVLAFVSAWYDGENYGAVAKFYDGVEWADYLNATKVEGGTHDIVFDFAKIGEEPEEPEEPPAEPEILSNDVCKVLCVSNSQHKGIIKVEDKYVCAVCGSKTVPSDYVIYFISGGTINYKLSPNNSEWSYDFDK